MIALLGMALRLLLLLLVARFVFQAVARAARGRRPLEDGRERPTTELVRDRICNTFLPRASAVPAVIGGREELFCSTVCADRARKS